MEHVALHCLRGGISEGGVRAEGEDSFVDRSGTIVADLSEASVDTAGSTDDDAAECGGVEIGGGTAEQLRATTETGDNLTPQTVDRGEESQRGELLCTAEARESERRA